MFRVLSVVWMVACRKTTQAIELPAEWESSGDFKHCCQTPVPVVCPHTLENNFLCAVFSLEQAAAQKAGYECN